MRTERFDYPPLALLISLTVQDDDTVFATTYPQQYHWLCQQDWFHITCFRWPEMMGRLLHVQLGRVVCQFQVEVPSEIAQRFADLKSAARK